MLQEPRETDHSSNSGKKTQFIKDQIKKKNNQVVLLLDFFLPKVIVVFKMHIFADFVSAIVNYLFKINFIYLFE